MQKNSIYREIKKINDNLQEIARSSSGENTTKDYNELENQPSIMAIY